MCTLIKFYDKDVLKNIASVITLKPEKIIFIYDNQIKDYNRFVSLKKCFSKHYTDYSFERYPININDLQEIYETVKSILLCNEECYIEFTGGSELMLMAGFKAGYDLNARLIYTDLIERLIKDTENNLIAKMAKICINDFVDAMGAKIIGNSKHEPKEEDYDNILNMADYIFHNLYDWKKTCSFIQTAMSQTAPSDLFLEARALPVKKYSRTSLCDKNMLFKFQKYGFIKELVFSKNKISFTFTSETSKQYLINYGVWLELFVFISAKRCGKFDDVFLGTMLDFNAYDGQIIQGNEIDVLLCDNSLPVFISCKLRNADTPALNELIVAKKRLGGWFSKAIIVAFGNEKKEKTGTYKRAKELGISMLDKSDILSGDFGEKLIKAIDENDLVKLKWNSVQ